jgi:sigma-B regulation protein RsbQ
MNVISRNHVNTLGAIQGQPMLFAHGFGCDQNMWRYIVPAFQELYRIVLFDYVGAGNSDLSAYSAERYSSLEGYAQDVLDVCHALDLDDVIFVGHSVSSMVGVLAAKREPERFSRLILVAPSPCYVNDPPYLGGFERADLEGLLEMMEHNLGWAKYLSTTVMKNPERPALTLELEESFCATDPEICKQFARTTFFSDNRADLAGVVTPSLIMQCSEDSIAPTEVGHYLHEHLPQSTLTLMTATGHCPHMSHPEETIRKMQAYLVREELAR